MIISREQETSKNMNFHEFLRNPENQKSDPFWSNFISSTEEIKTQGAKLDKYPEVFSTTLQQRVMMARSAALQEANIFKEKNKKKLPMHEQVEKNKNAAMWSDILEAPKWRTAIKDDNAKWITKMKLEHNKKAEEIQKKARARAAAEKRIGLKKDSDLDTCGTDKITVHLAGLKAYWFIPTAKKGVMKLPEIYHKDVIPAGRKSNKHKCTRCTFLPMFEVEARNMKSDRIKCNSCSDRKHPNTVHVMCLSKVELEESFGALLDEQYMCHDCINDWKAMKKAAYARDIARGCKPDVIVIPDDDRVEVPKTPALPTQEQIEEMQVKTPSYVPVEYEMTIPPPTPAHHTVVDAIVDSWFQNRPVLNSIYFS
jgi:hypothetical protein